MNFDQKQKYIDLLCSIVARLRLSGMGFPPNFLKIVDFLYKLLNESSFGIDLENFTETLITLWDYQNIQESIPKDEIIKIIHHIFSTNDSKLFTCALILIEKIFRRGFLDESLYTPEILEKLGKNSEAINAYKQIKNKYATSYQALNIDKYIERASIK